MAEFKGKKIFDIAKGLRTDDSDMHVGFYGAFE